MSIYGAEGRRLLLTPEKAKAIRQILGLSQADMAIAIGRCSARQIGAYETGEREIDRTTARCYAYVLRHGLLPEVAKAIRERRAKDGRRKQSTRKGELK
jgi:transcriptional regulator with XRE-family HTH domain